MAIGDQNNILGRLISYLPRSWFDGDSNPVRDAVLSGLAAGHAFIYSILAYVRLQTRIKTASEGFLDLISQDFFGGAVPRATNENDARFLSRILINLFRERATRRGVIEVLVDLTGLTPIIIEPWNPADCGAYGSPNRGYGVAGYYGSMLLQYQGFVKVFRPSPSGIANVAGYGFSGVSESAIGALLFDGAPVAPVQGAGSKMAGMTESGIGALLFDGAPVAPVLNIGSQTEGAYGSAPGGYGAPGQGEGATEETTESLSPASVLFDGAPVQNTVSTTGGYQPAPGGYGAGQIEYGSLDMVQGSVTDALIFEAVASVIPEGTIAWVNIGNPA